MNDSHTQEVLQLFERHQTRIKGFVLALLPVSAAAWPLPGRSSAMGRSSFAAQSANLP
jgi:hypothetical protein